MSILYAISIVYIAGEYDGPGFCTPIGRIEFRRMELIYTDVMYNCICVMCV